MSRTGTDESLTSYLAEYEHLVAKESEIVNRISQLGSTTASIQELEQLRKLLNTEYSKKKRIERILAAPKSESTPLLNSANRFKINNTLHNKLEYWDSLGEYKVPEAFDTLINAAIDNLKLNYLSDARINVASGSTIVGLLSVGVPLKTAVQLMYQPIFDPLFSGKINRLDSWLAELKQEPKIVAALESAEYQNLTDEDLLAGLDFRKSFGNQVPLESILNDPEMLASQIQALLVFERAHKIGEDIRNLADFMNIIRELDVFVEDVDSRRSKFHSNIGQVVRNQNGESILISPSDFSLLIPNLFTSNPHLLEAYNTFETLENLITDTFMIHSKEIRQFAKQVYKYMDLSDEGEIASEDANLVDMRRNLAAYLLTTIV